AVGGREGFLGRIDRTECADGCRLVRSNLCAKQVGNCDRRDDQNDRHDDEQFDKRKALLVLLHCFSLDPKSNVSRTPWRGTQRYSARYVPSWSSRLPLWHTA